MHPMLNRLAAVAVAVGGLTLAPSALASHIASPHHRSAHHTTVHHQPIRIQAVGRRRTLPRPPD